MSRYIFSVLSILAAASLLGLRGSSYAADEAPYKTLSTGVGADERVPHPEFSTKFVFAEREGGNLVADVQVKIFVKAKDGERKIIDTTSPDPWFFVDLPAGKYHVEATFQAKTLGQEFRIEGKSQKEIYLRW